MNKMQQARDIKNLMVVYPAWWRDTEYRRVGEGNAVENQYKLLFIE